MDFVEANGAKIPAIGLGTWELRDRTCARIVEQALRLGYRHIDTAQVYENEREVGEGVRASGVKRDGRGNPRLGGGMFGPPPASGGAGRADAAAAAQHCHALQGEVSLVAEHLVPGMPACLFHRAGAGVRPGRTAPGPGAAARNLCGGASTGMVRVRQDPHTAAVPLDGLERDPRRMVTVATAWDRLHFGRVVPVSAAAAGPGAKVDFR
jgi:hypothetical protein